MKETIIKSIQTILNNSVVEFNQNKLEYLLIQIKTTEKSTSIDHSYNFEEIEIKPKNFQDAKKLIRFENQISSYLAAIEEELNDFLSSTAKKHKLLKIFIRPTRIDFEIQSKFQGQLTKPIQKHHRLLNVY